MTNERFKSLLWVMALVAVVGALVIKFMPLDVPPDPCVEERRIAFDDGYTLGYSDAVDQFRKRCPDQFFSAFPKRPKQK